MRGLVTLLVDKVIGNSCWADAFQGLCFKPRDIGLHITEAGSAIEALHSTKISRALLDIKYCRLGHYPLHQRQSIWVKRYKGKKKWKRKKFFLQAQNYWFTTQHYIKTLPTRNKEEMCLKNQQEQEGPTRFLVSIMCIIYISKIYYQTKNKIKSWTNI